ncbi:MAG: hypothetical protein WC880_02450 [Candidatus Paceibacterota bacterium]
MKQEGAVISTDNPFEQLREKVHVDMELAIARRIKENPTPTEEELLIGAFKEMIEPQVQNAVMELCRKGYSTASSGFGGLDGGQTIDGYFVLDEKTKATLETMGVEVLTGADTGLKFLKSDYTSLHFKPLTLDLQEIEKQWTAIVEQIPTRGFIAEPSVNGTEFQEKYAPHRTDIEQKRIERMLILQKMAPWKVEQLQKRLKELTGK